MKKRAIYTAMTLILMTGLVFLSMAVYAGESMTKGGYQSYEMIATIGTSVHNPQGEYLGRIGDFVYDAEGHVDFAILSVGGFWRIGGKRIAVPFAALSYDSQNRHFILDTTAERLESAPRYDSKALGDRKWADQVYRYFGLQPYWTEGETTEHPMR